MKLAWFNVNRILVLFLGWFSVLIVTLNIAFFHNPLVGVFSFIIFILIVSFLLSGCINYQIKGRIFLSFLCVISTILVISLFSFYFYRLTSLSIIVSLWLIVLAITIINKRSANLYLSEQQNYSEDEDKKYMLFNKLSILYPLFFVFIWAQLLILFQIRLSGHIYNGFLKTPQNFSPIFLCIAFLILLILVFSKVNKKYILFAIIVLYLVSSAIYVVTIKDLYGADSWRHLAIEKYIMQGNKYEPTNLIEILKFKSEKIPNASLYTIIPTLSRITQVDILLIHKYLSIFILAPLFLLLLYYGICDFIKDSRMHLFFLLILLLSPGVIYLAQNTSVQGIGVFYFTINLWLWIRYLLGKDKKLQFYHYIITIVACLAYPTTAYFSAITVLLVLFIKFIAGKKKLINPLAYFWLIGSVIAIIVPILDIYLKKIPLDSIYKSDWVSTFSIIGQWWQIIFPIIQNNPGLSPIIFILMIVGLIWLYKKEKNRIFILLATLFFALQAAQWSSSLFNKNTPAIFSGRVYFLLSIVYFCLVFCGVYILLKKLIITRNRFLIILVVLLLSIIFTDYTNINHIQFGWSTSKSELKAINYIKKNNLNSSYTVLADEVTSAAGTALTKFDGGMYYWYPDGDLYLSYINLLKSPNKDTLESICRKFKRQNIYFIDTPIPLTSSYPEAEEILQKLMTVKWSEDSVKVMEYECRID